MEEEREINGARGGEDDVDIDVYVEVNAAETHSSDAAWFYSPLMVKFKFRFDQHEPHPLSFIDWWLIVVWESKSIKVIKVLKSHTFI